LVSGKITRSLRQNVTY